MTDMIWRGGSDIDSTLLKRAAAVLRDPIRCGARKIDLLLAHWLEGFSEFTVLDRADHSTDVALQLARLVVGEEVGSDGRQHQDRMDGSDV